ncbi:hypothetical protein HNR42_001470 [Deinobacterium chartae]|uniref:TRAP transporter solute receptor, TAXI family n=1 Tax=Deinobacterium chartae TaxID=521158 RepID=A0A841HXB4_9DEIO|nr:TAXI family TRAP transporter solute-binding subunit [Deinobacterium chartae]MBB6098047.1 hypothetical protein [Deinobacterium chartae]
MTRNLLLSAALAASVAGSSALAQREFITIGSGSTTGVYFPIASGMAKLINDANDGLRANARSTGGSVFNVTALGSGELQMATVQNDIAFYAYNGKGVDAFNNKPVKSLRAIAALYPEVIHIVARKDAKINSVEDLKGKRVVVGDVGSGTEQNAAQILEAYGLSFKDLGQTVRVNATQGAQLLQDGRADVLFYTVGIGASAIQQIALTTPINIVPVDGKQARDITKKYPYYVTVNIPTNSYKGQNVFVPTVAVQAMLLTTDKESEDAVYKAMKAMFDKQDAFKALHPNLEKYFTLQKAVKGLPVPLHPGAAKYFKEKNISVK